LIKYYKENFNYDYWKIRNVKFLKPLPIFGNYLPAILMQMSTGKLLEKIHRHYENEPYVGFYIFNKPYLLIKDPKIIQSILVKDFTKFNNRSTASVIENDFIGTYSLFALKDTEWKVLRSKVLPFFSTKQMKLMFELITDVGEHLNEEIKQIYNKKTNIIETKDTAGKFASDIIAACVYGIPPPNEFLQISKSIFEASVIRNFELNSFFFMPIFAAIFKFTFIGHKATNYLRMLFWNIINTREMEVQHNSKMKQDNFLNFLIELRKNKEISLTHDKLVAQAIIFFTAGIEGPATAISQGLYHIALNSNIQRRLRKEIKQALADNNNELTFEIIKEMPYLDACVRESFRMAIALPFLDRQASEDYKVPGTDLIIEKGMGIFISLYGMHYDPKYFPNPNKFDPERFLTNKSKLDQFAYLPFGAGPRNCIGARFADIQVKIGLINILKDFQVEAAKKIDEPFKAHPRGFFYTLANGYDLRFKKDDDIND
ncbi:cytochrome P450 6k1-like, partial [Chrysoperla carnea]|uniref:cytochrome P450 6k1-like n=1 Tax=Chrysoperla carnea TaxID=189513 RepID=UPI001D082FA5